MMKGGHGPTNSYLTVIVVHSTMHLMHHNHYTQTKLARQYMLGIDTLMYDSKWNNCVCTCVCAYIPPHRPEHMHVPC